MDDIIRIEYVKGKGFELEFPAEVDGKGTTVKAVLSEAATKTLENVLKIRRLHGAPLLVLPVGATTGSIKPKS